jgi:hypothetical protein
MQREMMENREEDMEREMCEDKVSSNNTSGSGFDSSAKCTGSDSPLSTVDKQTLTKTSVVHRPKRRFPFKYSKVISNKRLHSELTPLYNDLDEKTKLERNRISARECRIRKKLYMVNLEQQIKSLRMELHECRRELNEYKTREQQRLFTEFRTQQLNLENLDPKFTERADNLTNRKILESYIVS